MSNSKLISNNTRVHVPHFYFDCHLRVLDIGFGNFLLIFFFLPDVFIQKVIFIISTAACSKPVVYLDDIRWKLKKKTKKKYAIILTEWYRHVGQLSIPFRTEKAFRFISFFLALTNKHPPEVTTTQKILYQIKSRHIPILSFHTSPRTSDIAQGHMQRYHIWCFHLK